MTLRVRHLIPLAVLGVVVTFLGSAWLSDVGDLRERTRSAVATVSADGSLVFTTAQGDVVAARLGDNCKQRVSAPPGRRCEVYFEAGDEVVLHYDPADPQHVWHGATPGGFGPTLTLYAGIIVLTSSLTLLWWAAGMPDRLRALKLLPAVRPARKDLSDGADSGIANEPTAR